jgi:hypothetical protein
LDRLSENLRELESSSGGVKLNLVPKDGGNSIRGSGFLCRSRFCSPRLIRLGAQVRF